MNKTIAVIYIMVMALSCAKSEVYDDHRDSNMIGFGSYAGVPVSKADGSLIESGTKIPSGKSLGVFAFNTGSSSFTGENETPDYMRDMALTYQGQSGYTYNPQRYWPTDEKNNKLTFFAYYPKADGNGIDSNVTSGLGKFDFTVNPDAAKQVDFMVSDVVANQCYSSNAGMVSLSMHHLLTKISFAAKTSAESDVTVKVKSIKVTDLCSQGVLTPEYAMGETSFSWSGLSSKSTFSVTIPDGGTVLSNEAKKVTSDNSGVLLMLPQNLGDSTIEVTYSTKSGSGVEDSESFTAKMISPYKDAEGHYIWPMNKSIVMTLNISLQYIEFDTEVVGWSDSETDITIGE